MVRRDWKVLLVDYHATDKLFYVTETNLPARDESDRSLQ